MSVLRLLLELLAGVLLLGVFPEGAYAASSLEQVLFVASVVTFSELLYRTPRDLRRYVLVIILFVLVLGTLDGYLDVVNAVHNSGHAAPDVSLFRAVATVAIGLGTVSFLWWLVEYERGPLWVRMVVGLFAFIAMAFSVRIYTL